jgi:hypothetical protein
MSARALIPLVLSVTLGSCFLDIGACTYEHRTLELQGTLTGPIGVAVSLNETRGSNPDFRTLNIMLTSGQFTGTIASAELRDASSTPARVLAVWPQGSSTAQLWNANVDLPTASPSHEVLATLARAGQLQLAVLLGPPGAGELTGMLSVKTDGNWNHPRCD